MGGHCRLKVPFRHRCKRSLYWHISSLPSSSSRYADSQASRLSCLAGSEKQNCGGCRCCMPLRGAQRSGGEPGGRGGGAGSGEGGGGGGGDHSGGGQGFGSFGGGGWVGPGDGGGIAGGKKRLQALQEAAHWTATETREQWPCAALEAQKWYVAVLAHPRARVSESCGGGDGGGGGDGSGGDSGISKSLQTSLASSKAGIPRASSTDRFPPKVWAVPKVASDAAALPPPTSAKLTKLQQARQPQ